MEGMKVKFKDTSKKGFKLIFRISRILALAFIGAMFVHSFMLSQAALQNQSMVHENYERVEHTNIYVDEETIPEEQLIKINKVYEKLSLPLLRIIEDKWIILVSKNCPFESFNTEAKIMGTTYFEFNVVWLDPYATEKQIAHEFGHILSFVCGEIHNEPEFLNLYWSNWNQYVEADKFELDSHCISSPGEYFAELYAEYLYFPGYLKECFNDGYNYISDLSHDYWRLTDVGRYHGIGNRMVRIVGNKLTSFIDNCKYDMNMFKEGFKNIFRKKLNPELHQESLYTFKYAETGEVLSYVQEIVKTEQTTNKVEYIFNKNLDYDIFVEINTVLQMYFLDNRNSIAQLGVGYDDGIYSIILFDVQQLKHLEAKRQVSLDNVDKLLSQIKSGSDEEILTQIAHKLWKGAENIYASRDTRASEYWSTGSCNSATIAMIFQQCAHRLGYTCDIVVSPLESGNNYFYNRVVMPDGSYKYYDVLGKNVHCDDLRHELLIPYAINCEYR